ncbi:MAG: hypothetical protein KIT11_02835 [Fimbriimonadaceae bacterium]|nr:hypothetical protein [Fimbriimonadaceae bacterium]QYK54696.1 MAG: hypothetical protein KF733_06690 [Fimbriimonadaceae bacterium]
MVRSTTITAALAAVLGLAIFGCAPQDSEISESPVAQKEAAQPTATVAASEAEAKSYKAVLSVPGMT